MGCVWRWVSVEVEVAVLEWVVLSEEWDCVGRGVRGSCCVRCALLP